VDSTDDVFDHVDVGLAPIQAHLAALSAPLGPRVSCHT